MNGVDKTPPELMRNRAQQNMLFVYIKIPEVPFHIFYKGNKETSQMTDVSNFCLQLPTIEYHNMTLTWHDLLIAVKNKARESMISQAIKQKLNLKKHRGGDQTGETHDDEQKAKMLLGDARYVNSKYFGGK